MLEMIIGLFDRSFGLIQASIVNVPGKSTDPIST